MIAVFSSNGRVAYLLSCIFERAGYVSIVATEPSAAVDLCQLQPEALVVDAVGGDACWDIVVSDAIRTLASPPSLLVLTSWSEGSVASDSVEVLAFPFAADEVTEALARLLRMRRAA